MKCPLCNSESKLAFNSKGIDILNRLSCGHRFAGIEANETHKNEVYDESEQKFNLIALIEVIYHFNGLDRVILKANRFLKPGGFVLVKSSNRNNWVVKLLGKRWHEYFPPSVVPWFSDKTISELLEFYGFNLVKGYLLKRIKLKHVISLIDTNTPEFILKHKILDFLSKSLGKLKLIYPPPIDVKWHVFKKRPARGGGLLRIKNEIL